jgi:hypothetical protein
VENQEQMQDAQENPETSSEAVEEKKEGDQVSTREDRRAQHDFLRFKQEAKQAQEDNAKLMNRIKEMEENSLAEKSNYKELYERKVQEVDKYKVEIEQRDKVFFNSLKNQEIEKEALKLGIRPEALEDIRNMDQGGVITETTSQGHVNVLGATEFVEQLKNTRPFWFRTQGAPTINTGVPGYSEKKLTTSEILKLQKENPKKYQEEVLKLVSRR